MASKQTSRLGSAPEEGVKAPVVAASTENLDLEGLPEVDGVQTVAGDRVLVMLQTDSSENGIYNAAAGTWSRSTDFNANNDVINGQLVVDANTSQVWSVVIGDDFTMDSSDISFIYTGLSSTEIVTIALALNVQYSEVIYSTDTTTELDDVLYIYSAAQGLTYEAPELSSTGETITSLTVDQLITSADTYTLTAYDPCSTLKTIALSLGVLESEVIYSDNAETDLDNVTYIYDASEQVTYVKPGDVGAGAVIVSLSDGTLTTDIGTYLIYANGYSDDIETIARSLNALDSEVIYSADTTTELDDVLYIYDTEAQVIYYKPDNVTSGDAIVSLSSTTLTTTNGSYTLVSTSKEHVFSSVSDMLSANVALYDLVKTGGTTWKRTTVSGDAVISDYMPQGSIFANDWGLTTTDDSDTVTVDNQELFQEAIDAGAGGTVYYSGFVGVGDTIYVPRGTNLIQLGNIDAWSGRTTGGGIVCIGSGTSRIWTDVGDEDRAFDSTWYDLEDDAITVGVVTEGDSKLQNVYVITQDDTPWDVGIFNPACKRVGHVNVDTGGAFAIAGYYIDATWGASSSNLLSDLHENTYGRLVNTDGASNESYHENCYYYGGIVGCMGKGTDRDPELADSVSDLVWSEGGVSDLVFNGCRFGNYPSTTDAPDKLRHALYFDWGYARDVDDRDSKYYQNRYFNGCSFRSDNYGRYSVLLDRSRYDNFVGVYGEIQTGYTTELFTATVSSFAEIIAPNPVAGTDGKAYKIEVAGDEWDIRTHEITIGATLTTTSGGEFRVRGIGYDVDTGTRYVVTRTADLTGTVTAGDTITQSAGQSVAATFAQNDRTQNTITIGQSQFQCASSTYGSLTGQYTYSPRAVLAGCVFREDHVQISSEGEQINWYANATGDNDRLRWSGFALLPYSSPTLGDASRMWDTVYATDGTINTSDENYKTFEDITDTEKVVATAIKAIIKKFKWNSAIKEKGEDKARIHFGVGAQSVKTIFEDNGLDPASYALFCYDEWDEEVDDGGVVVTEAGSRYGIRYTELAMFMLCAI